MNDYSIKIYSCILILISGIIVYSSSLNSPFHLDDYQNIKDNNNIRITDISINSLFQVYKNSKIHTRPVSYITFALNYYFSKDNVYFYRLTNVAIHLLSGLLLYLVILNTIDIYSEFNSEKNNYLISYANRFQ